MKSSLGIVDVFQHKLHHFVAAAAFSLLHRIVSRVRIVPAKPEHRQCHCIYMEMRCKKLSLAVDAAERPFFCRSHDEENNQTDELPPC